MGPASSPLLPRLISFDDGPDGYNSPGAGRGSYQARGAADSGGYPIRTTQDPIYPTIAAAGGSATGSTPGARGTITKGDPTRGAPATAEKGGAGWAGASGNGVGAGAGGDVGKLGAGGAVMIVIELLSNGPSNVVTQ